MAIALPLFGIAAAPSSLDAPLSSYRRGDRVQVWSPSQNAWLEGRVEEVVSESNHFDDGQTPIGSVRVATARCVLVVPPSKVAQAMRLVSDEAALVAVIGPGAGISANKSVYDELDRDARFRVQVLGQRGEPYDCYPECWDGGSRPPNLDSFAGDVLAQGILERCDCVVAGSRGGQVVLPRVWRALGRNTPPAVVLNGGCAMQMPGPAVEWPQNAVTIIVIGGDDYFRGTQPAREYVIGTRGRVPAGNMSTAILYVREMEHMPQKGLLQLLLAPLLLAAIYWKVSGRAPVFELQAVLKDLAEKSWNGHLSYLDASGTWQEVGFGAAAKQQPDSPTSARTGALRKSRTKALVLAEQEVARVAELEQQVGQKEEELRNLREQLAGAREKARRLQEAAVKARFAEAGAAAKEAPAQQPSGTPPVLYQRGQRVQYLSVTQHAWLECEVTAVRADGAVQISAKLDCWLLREEQATKLRSAALPARPKLASAMSLQIPVVPHSRTVARSPPPPGGLATNGSAHAGGVWNVVRTAVNGAAVVLPGAAPVAVSNTGPSVEPAHSPKRLTSGYTTVGSARAMLPAAAFVPVNGATQPGYEPVSSAMQPLGASVLRVR